MWTLGKTDQSIEELRLKDQDTGVQIMGLSKVNTVSVLLWIMSYVC